MEVQFVELILRQRLVANFEAHGVPRDQGHPQAHTNVFLQRCLALQQSIPNIITEYATIFFLFLVD
jgi:hypothetical protein